MRYWMPLAGIVLALLLFGVAGADEVQIDEPKSPFSVVSHAESSSDPFDFQDTPAKERREISQSFTIDFDFIADTPNYTTVHEAKTPIFTGLILGAAFFWYWRRQRHTDK